jgi:hypothetical protein
MKKIIITESQLKSVVDSLFSEVETSILNEATTPIEVKVSFNFKSAYPVNSSDPTPFLADFTKTLLDKINATPNGPAMLKSGEMTLSNGTFTAGASNTWLGKVTPYDKENNYLAPPKGQNYEDPLYKKNVDLAMARAQAFRPALFNFLKQNKISDSDVAKVAFKTMVLNTGGVKDESRDTAKYPNPGQFMLVSLVFKYKKDMTTKTTTGTTITSTKEIKTYTDIKKHMVLTGSYYCNGKNSVGTPSGQPEMIKAMKENCEGVGGVKPENSKYSMAFEIKWDTNVLKDPYTVPILRWMFHFNAQGKIDKIIRYVYNKEYIFLRDHVPQTTVPLNDKEMKFYMGIKAGQPETGGPFYEKFIQPYI